MRHVLSADSPVLTPAIRYVAQQVSVVIGGKARHADHPPHRRPRRLPPSVPPRDADRRCRGVHRAARTGDALLAESPPTALLTWEWLRMVSHLADTARLQILARVTVTPWSASGRSRDRERLGWFPRLEFLGTATREPIIRSHRPRVLGRKSSAVRETPSPAGIHDPFDHVPSTALPCSPSSAVRRLDLAPFPTASALHPLRVTNGTLPGAARTLHRANRRRRRGDRKAFDARLSWCTNASF